MVSWQSVEDFWMHPWLKKALFSKEATKEKKQRQIQPEKVQQNTVKRSNKNDNNKPARTSTASFQLTHFALQLLRGLLGICKRSMLKPDDVTLLHLRYVDLSYGACLRASTWWPDQFTCRNREGPDQVSSFFPVLVGKRCMARVSLMESAQKQEIERRGRWAYRAEFNKVSHHLSSLFLVNDLFT